MKYFLLLFVLVFISCSEDDTKGELISFDELCSYTSSNLITETCSGAEVLHIKDRKGKMEYSDEFGYYVNFSVEMTYDCAILGIVCEGDYKAFVGSIVSVTADIHEYTGKHHATIGGQKLYALAQVKIN